MNAANLHLIVNHFPVVTLILGIPILTLGLLFKSKILKMLGLSLFIFSGISAVPAFLSGEGAEEVIEHVSGVSESLIEEHEHAAKSAMISIVILSALAVLTLLAERLRSKGSTVFSLGVILVALISTGFTVRAAHRGGLIRHPEIASAADGAAGAIDDDDSDGDGAGASQEDETGKHKWKADDTLKGAMKSIETGLKRLETKNLKPTELAHHVTTEIANMIKNCKLTPQADHALHGVIGELSSAVTFLKSAESNSQAEGARKVKLALQHYSSIFE